jgi:NAD(P)-dependent dehydrogenase (short-subunit alcohol dehydrogenase family)
MRLKEKVALVTGGSRGIGEAISKRFAREGARVLVAARSIDRCEAVAKEIRSAGGEAAAQPCDVAETDSREAAVAAAVARWGRIDVLVNNAGSSGHTPLDLTVECGATWDRILATNLTAAFQLSRAALPHMPDGGRILHQSSVLGRFGVPGYSAYCAAKHGVIGLTRAMALELAPRRITVNAICPGWVDTEMARQGWERIAKARGVSLEKAREIAAHNAPLGRVLEPEEIAALAVYIASEEAANLTGQAIVLDGGQVMP